MGNPAASPANSEVFRSFRGRDNRNRFSHLLRCHLVNDGIRASGNGEERILQHLHGSESSSHKAAADDAPTGGLAQFKGKRRAKFVDFSGRDILTKILGDRTYATEQFLRRNPVEALAKPTDTESSDIWFVGIEKGTNEFSKASFLRVAFCEFSTHYEVQSFLADIIEISQPDGLTHLLIRLVRRLPPFVDSTTYPGGDWTELIREIMSTERVLVILDDAHQIEQIKRLVQMSAGVLLGNSVFIAVRSLVTLRGKSVLSIESRVEEEMSVEHPKFLFPGVGDIVLDRFLQRFSAPHDQSAGSGGRTILQGLLMDNTIPMIRGSAEKHLNLQTNFEEVSCASGCQGLQLLRCSYSRQGNVLPQTLYKEVNSGRSGTKYEVVLSFDSGLQITDHLYRYMEQAGIHIFRSNKKLCKGKEIDKELLLAMMNCKICIPIFSGGYAWRTRCLHELASMVEARKKSTGLEILPVFYDVKPSDVMPQSRLYHNAMRHHRLKHPHDKVHQWEEALKEVAVIKGWESKKRNDAELCKSIVRGVMNKLRVKHVSAHSVGTEDEVEAIKGMLDLESGGVIYVGIHGASGVGKTTLAKVIFSHISALFEGCSFIANVQESSKLKGLTYLQEQLCRDIAAKNCENKAIRERFRGKKVLIILDDVDRKEQINGLAGRPSWFGSGSRIIITTRNSNMLANMERISEDECIWKQPTVLRVYGLKEMGFDKALQLFSRHAFGNDLPLGGYCNLSKQIVSLTGGLPLALETIASFLNRKSEDVWSSTLKKLQEIPHHEIKKILMTIYEALDHETQQIFLDIACFFVGTNRTNPAYMWEACGFNMYIELEVLEFISMVKVVDGKLWMHDLVKDMGRDIARDQGVMDKETRTRLWVHEEVLDVLMRKEGKQTIEALQSYFDDPLWDYTLTSEELGSLQNLRFLEFYGGHLGGDMKWCLQKLIWLSWHFCPPNIEATNLCLQNLAILDLSRSSVSHQWGGWSQIRMANCLKVLNLTSCQDLTRTPEFSGYKTLERLILEDCRNLVEIDSSIGKLRHLTHLNVMGCSSLRGLPQEIRSLKGLREINMRGKGQRFMVPESTGDLASLSTYQIADVEIVEFPLHFMLEKLEHLSLSACSGVVKIPSSIGSCKSLLVLDLSGARVTDLPDSIRHLQKLKMMNLESSWIRKLPGSIGGLENLEELNAKHCNKLEGPVPAEIGSLSCLRILDLSFTNICSLPKTMNQLSLLQQLHLISCDNLQELPELPKSLVNLQIKSRMLQSLPDLSEMERLAHLELQCSNDKQNIRFLSFHSHRSTRLSVLEDFELCIPNITFPSTVFNAAVNLRKLSLAHLLLDTIMPRLRNLRRLAILELKNCSMEGYQHGREELSSLEHLHAYRCRFPRINLILLGKKLRTLRINQCESSLDGSLDLSGLTNLTVLELTGCKQLTEVQGLGGLEFLEDLVISDCSALESLSDLSNSLRLEVLKIDGCDKLTTVEGISNIKSLKHLHIYGSISLGGLKEQLNSKKRRRRLPIRS